MVEAGEENEAALGEESGDDTQLPEENQLSSFLSIKQSIKGTG